MRTLGGTFKDLFTFKFKRLYQRYSVFTDLNVTLLILLNILLISKNLQI